MAKKGFFLYLMLLACAAFAREKPKPLEEVLPLYGIELFKAARDTTGYGGPKLSKTDWFRLLERLCEESEAALEQDSSYASWHIKDIYKKACAQAEAADFPRLVKFYEKSPEFLRMRGQMLVPLAQLWVRQELAQIAAEKPGPVKLPPLDKYTGAMASYSPELTEARNTYLAAMQPCKNREEIISYDKYQKDYTNILISLLKREKYDGDEPRSARLASFYEERGDCGFRDTSFDDSQPMGIWMALLAERRFPEAVGAAMLLQHNEEEMIVEFLKLCGLDWEKIFLGALASDTEHNRWRGRLSAGALHGFLRTIAAQGSEQCVPLLMELSRRTGMAGGQYVKARDYWAALAVFVQEEPRKEGAANMTYGWPNFDLRKQLPPASEAVQRQILKFFIQTAQKPNISKENLESLIIILGKLRCSEAKALFTASMKRVPTAAHDALGWIGENAKKPVPEKTVRFLFLENGEPLRKFPVHWYMVSSAKRGTQHTSHSGRTDENGILHFSRDEFANPAVSLRFQQPPYWKESSPLVAVFRVELTAPFDISKTTTVPLETMPLTLTLEPHRDVYEGKTVNISIEKWHKRGDKHSYETVMVSLQTLYAQKLPLPNLPPGKYRINAHLPHAARASVEIEHPQAEPSVMKLAPGADIQIQIRKPPELPFVVCEIYREGEQEPLTDLRRVQGDIWEGLPVGRYRLHIPSKQGRTMHGWHSDETAPRFEPIDIPFTIDENSPALIDLGEVRLKAL